MANLAALRAVVFSLSAKNLTGGGVEINPPAGARVNPHMAGGLSHLRTAGGRIPAPPENSKTKKDSDKR